MKHEDMREIKFRAKIKGDAGVYHVWAIDWLYQRAYIERACGDEWVPFDKIQEFMQYTGLKDKNGKEIYEGDKVEIICEDGPDRTIEDTGTVCWSDIHAGFYIEYDADSAVPLSSPEAIEVIGNIHQDSHLLDNPDLLDEQEARK